jgi:hypothetical protein
MVYPRMEIRAVFFKLDGYLKIGLLIVLLILYFKVILTILSATCAGDVSRT